MYDKLKNVKWSERPDMIISTSALVVSVVLTGISLFVGHKMDKRKEDKK